VVQLYVLKYQCSYSVFIFGRLYPVSSLLTYGSTYFVLIYRCRNMYSLMGASPLYSPGSDTLYSPGAGTYSVLCTRLVQVLFTHLWMQVLCPLYWPGSGTLCSPMGAGTLSSVLAWFRYSLLTYGCRYSVLCTRLVQVLFAHLWVQVLCPLYSPGSGTRY
jgi:hypothetical protein